ncbi:MAG: hypothetical protein A2Y60_06520 [Chloroflexi bacterium RBG_13_54_9]|nr:MAG: hypothetical protein A2Y60_06520 [Chloroflexi bacterium RBG_13_54_9]
MTRIQYTETDQQGLDLIGALWQKLNEHHKVRSQQFESHYDKMTFEMRKEELLDKSEKGTMRIDLARDVNTGKLVGYCVSTVSRDRQGEIESIYIETDYRRSGIGDSFMKRALRWMDDLSVTKIKLEVGVGNEEVFAFYKLYDFYPRSTILWQVETREADKTG